MNKSELFCCFVGDSGRCEALAEWIVAYGASPDDLTHSCTTHVGELLSDAKEHRIYPIECESARPEEK